MNKLTTRQKKAFEGLTEGKTYRRALEDAGYAPSVAKMGMEALKRCKNMQARLNRLFENDEEALKQDYNDFQELYEQAKQSQDLSNANRAKENMVRMKGGFTDRSLIENTKPDAMIIVYANKPSPDDKIDEVKDKVLELSERVRS